MPVQSDNNNLNYLINPKLTKVNLNFKKIQNKLNQS